MVSTLVYAVYDLMSDKMKDYKQHTNFPETAATSSVDVLTTFPESKVNLFRYSGFALHSFKKVLQTYTKALFQGHPHHLKRHLRVKDDKLGTCNPTAKSGRTRHNNPSYLPSSENSLKKSAP